MLAGQLLLELVLKDNQLDTVLTSDCIILYYDRDRIHYLYETLPNDIKKLKDIRLIPNTAEEICIYKVDYYYKMDFQIVERSGHIIVKSKTVKLQHDEVVHMLNRILVNLCIIKNNMDGIRFNTTYHKNLGIFDGHGRQCFSYNEKLKFLCNKDRINPL